MPRKRNSHIFDKQKHGHYVEPSWCSERLLAVEKFSGIIYDPACGWGTITKAASEAGYRVAGSDIINRRRHHLKWFKKLDFLNSTNINAVTLAGSFSIICNPPFDHVEEFCRRSLEIGARKVAMICLVRRLNAARWLLELPLKRVLLLTPRPSMPPGSYLASGKKPGGGKQDFCWLLFERGYNSKPSLEWLKRDA